MKLSRERQDYSIVGVLVSAGTELFSSEGLVCYYVFILGEKSCQ